MLMAFNPGPFSKDRGCRPCLRTQSHSQQVDTSMWAGSWLVIAIQHDFCGEFCSWSFQLCCPLRFLSSPLTLPVRGFPTLWKLLLHYSLPKTGLHLEILCLPFCLYPLFYLILKRLACLSGYLGFSNSVQKLFCGSCLLGRWSFDVFWGEKVLFPCHLGTAPPETIFVVTHNTAS